jgi:small subunit ribosomal protein S20
MANIASQMKRNRQNVTRHARNKAVRSELKTRMKRFEQAAEVGDRDEAASRFQIAARKLDKAARKGVVHTNFAANKKAKMAKRLSSL